MTSKPKKNLYYKNWPFDEELQVTHTMTKEEEKALCALVRFGMLAKQCVTDSGDSYIELSKTRLLTALDFYEACGMSTFSGATTDEMRAACNQLDEDCMHCDLYVKAEPLSNDRKND